tara:strand:- start:189 stop:911 length:723 start_codon:yes stop_codon:yes gene_type:complete
MTSLAIIDTFETVKEALGFGNPVPSVPEVFFALAVSFGLNLIIGALYKSTYRGTRYSQDYVHTLVIVGTVTTILILVVGSHPNASAIGFGMFAAFAMIRFRRNLGQARDLAFILFSMMTGMVVGARLYPTAVATTIVMVAAIYILSKKEAFAPKRASHQLRIRVNNDIQYDQAFAPIFEEFADATELISVESIQAGMMTELRWGILLKSGAKVSDFMEKLQVSSGNNRVILTSTQRSFDN